MAGTEEIRQGFPFELKGMDTDNGEEFINYDLDRYCRSTGVKRFRSRPYKKDDQAHIEQKNGTHVRRLIGWDRYDAQQAVDAMNDLYRNEWRLLTNLFLPSVKLDYKTRRGSKIKRIYQDAKTPLDRLLESGQGDRVKLAKGVERKLQAIWKLASRSMIKATPLPRARKPWWESPAEDEDAALGQLEIAQDR